MTKPNIGKILKYAQKKERILIQQWEKLQGIYNGQKTLDAQLQVMAGKLDVKGTPWKEMNETEKLYYLVRLEKWYITVHGYGT